MFGVSCSYSVPRPFFLFFFFFNDTATTEIYTLSLHDALPILHRRGLGRRLRPGRAPHRAQGPGHGLHRSEEHTSELQSRLHLVCRLLLEKKNTLITAATSPNAPRSSYFATHTAPTTSHASYFS